MITDIQYKISTKYWKTGAGTMLYGLAIIMIMVLVFTLLIEAFMFNQNRQESQNTVDAISDGTAWYLMNNPNDEQNVGQVAESLNQTISGAYGHGGSANELKISNASVDSNTVSVTGGFLNKHFYGNDAGKTYSIIRTAKTMYSGLDAVFGGADYNPDVSDGEFCNPMQKGTYIITSDNGFRGGSITASANGIHYGIDMAAALGTPVYAACDGTVSLRRMNGGYGTYIILTHNNFHIYYGHLIAYAAGLKDGDTVRKGQKIGHVGSTGRSTGPHLHFEIRDISKGNTRATQYVWGEDVQNKLGIDIY